MGTTQTFWASLKEIIGGTPIEVLIKLALAAVAALWANLQVIGIAVFLTFIMQIIDAGMGAAIAKKNGKEFSVKYFTIGPLKKLSLTFGMLLVSAMVDSMIPGNFLNYAVTAFISGTTLLDVAKKYGTLSGSKLANFLEDKLGSLIKGKDEKAGQ